MEKITEEDLKNLPDEELKDLLNLLENINEELETIEEGDINE